MSGKSHSITEKYVRLHLKYNTEIISKLFQCFVSHVTTSGTEAKLFQLLEEFRNHFKIVSVTMSMLENMQIQIQNNFEIISGKFPRAEIFF